MGHIKKDQHKLLEMKAMSVMKSRLHETNSRLDIAEEKVSELEDIIIETIRNKTQKENRLRTTTEY